MVEQPEDPAEDDRLSDKVIASAPKFGHPPRSVPQLEDFMSALLLRWTTDQPTEPGWYWWQPTYSKPEVVFIQQISDTWPLTCDRAGYDTSAMPRVGRWAGPIPPPEGTP